ncbi:MAG: sugar transferase [Minisyncoccota bacterium]
MAFDRRETIVLIIGDFFILIASLWVALFLRNLSLPPPGYFESNLAPFLPVFLISLGIFYIAGLYEKQTRPIRRVMGARILGAQAANVAIAAILFFVLPLSIAPKTILLLYLVASVAAESAWRFYRMNREADEGEREAALLIGRGPAVLELYEEVNRNDRYRIRFAECVDPKGLSQRALSKAVAGGIEAGSRIIVIDTSDPNVSRDLLELYDLLAEGIVFIEFASLYEEIFDRVPLGHLDAGRLFESLPKHRAFYNVAKRTFDIVLALVGTIIAIPFIIISAVLLALEGGTPFIRHDRIGRNGRVFRIVKMRTMLFNDHGDPELQKKNRVTALGRLLRKARIDELPQLWNVLVGDLSFIGPRPELPTIASVYEREIPQYRLRHLIAPGLSGWAQIHDYDAPRGSADVARTEKKVSFDLYYLKHRSFGLDLAIAVKTIRALLSFSGT